MLLLLLSVVTLSYADVCSDLARSDVVTIGEFVSAGCARTLISRIRRSEETYHNLNDGHGHEEEGHEEEGLGHDDHGEEHSVQEECEETAGHKWCPTETEMSRCFDTADASKQTEYCECSEGVSATDVKWDTTNSACTSTERTDCDAKGNSTQFAYWNSICYEAADCKLAGLTWKAGKAAEGGVAAVPAVCASALWFCGLVHDTKFDNGACSCSEGSDWHGTHCHAQEKKKPSKTAAWGYGFISVAIISAFAIFGVVILVFREKWWYDIVLSTMVALAVGSLLADALLHLVPLALGLHQHEGHDDHAGHEEEEEKGEHNTLNKCMGVLGGIYIFLLFEKAIHSVIPHDHGHGGDGHEHGGKVIDNPNAGAELKDLSPRRESLKSVARKGMCNVDSVAWMVIFGDALHNFADGLVLGASFAASLSLGLGTSIAVLCHELPHELGDFAVLLNAGMQVKWAIIFNFLSACTCFLGLFLGLIIGEDDQTQQWIFAFTAGMFIYISCADLIPEMNRMCETSSHPKITFLLQQVGFWFGVLIMLLIALYEEELESLAN